MSCVYFIGILCSPWFTFFLAHGISHVPGDHVFKCCMFLANFSHLLQLGGLNSLLAVEHSPSIPMVSKVPTIILGMDVSHGSPGQSDIPSIAAVTCLISYLLYDSIASLLLRMPSNII